MVTDEKWYSTLSEVLLNLGWKKEKITGIEIRHCYKKKDKTGTHELIFYFPNIRPRTVIHIHYLPKMKLANRKIYVPTDLIIKYILEVKNYYDWRIECSEEV
jgi:hypothetical protein